LKISEAKKPKPTKQAKEHFKTGAQLYISISQKKKAVYFENWRRVEATSKQRNGPFVFDSAC
jgi:hypothetical protein